MMDARVHPRFGRGPYAMTIGEAMRFDGDVEDREYVRSVSGAIMRRISLLACESARRVEDALSAEAAGPRWLKDARSWLPMRV